MRMYSRSVTSRSALLISAAAAFALAGCSSSSTPRAGSLSAADFRAPDADAAPAAMAERRLPALRAEDLDPSAVGPGFTVLEGPPTLAPDVPVSTTEKSVMMDALIGDINGSPIYATEFFAPIDARLAGIAAKHRNNRQAWLTEAQNAIGGIVQDRQTQRTVLFGRLGDLIRDELLLAEARASLSPEQKQGLLHFVEQVRRDLVARGGGGQAAVDQNLRDQGEEGLEAKLKENIDRQLVYANLREKILPRVTISWHAVQVEYDRRAEEFNPSPTAVFRVIWLPSTSAQLVDQFAADIARGASFVELSERPENLFTGGIHKQVFKGDYASAQLFGPKEFNEPARTLQPGGIAGPLQFSGRTAWIYLDHIDTPKSTPIYDAQLKIFNELREKKLNAEMDKYLLSLVDKQSFDKLHEMSVELVVVATERYFQPAGR